MGIIAVQVGGFRYRRPILSVWNFRTMPSIVRVSLRSHLCVSFELFLHIVNDLLLPDLE
jgi:hypothetical protein